MNAISICLFLVAFGYGVAISHLIVGLFQWAYGGEESRKRIRDLMGWKNIEVARSKHPSRSVPFRKIPGCQCIECRRVTQIDRDYRKALQELDGEFPGMRKEAACPEMGELVL